MSDQVEQPIEPEVWEALRGAYDLQVHIEPDIIPRRVDDLTLAHDFLEHGLAGFVLKSHYTSTAERATVVSRAVPGIAALGALTLNHAVGGLNPVAVDVAGRSGARVIWMPTVDSLNEAQAAHAARSASPPMWVAIQEELAAHDLLPAPLRVLNEDGSLLPPVIACMERIAAYDMVLATGHLDRREIFALVASAHEHGVHRVIVTHAEFPAEDLSPSDQVQLADMGAYIEHCYTTPHTGKCTWRAVADGIRAVGPERSILSTDLGQPHNPPVVDGLALFGQQLLDAGFSLDDLRTMTVTNPTKLIRAGIRTAEAAVAGLAQND